MFNASNDPRFAVLRAAYRAAAATAERPESTAADYAAWLAAQAAYYKAGGRDPANGWPVPANRKTMTKGEVDAKATMAFRRVTGEEFHAALNADPRDIMPTIVSGNDPITGYTSEWRAQTLGRALFGKTDGYGVTSESGRYWLYEVDSSAVTQLCAALDGIALAFPRYADTVASQKALAETKAPAEAEKTLELALYLYWADADRPEALRRHALADAQRLYPGKWDGTLEEHAARSAASIAQMEIREAARGRTPAPKGGS